MHSHPWMRVVSTENYKKKPRAFHSSKDKREKKKKTEKRKWCNINGTTPLRINPSQVPTYSSAT